MTNQYLANENTKEIHNLENKLTSCNLALIKDEHKTYLNELKAILFIKVSDYNGCKFCLQEYHTK